MPELHSPREVALAMGVSESTLKRWVDNGLIQAERTAGGHRRLSREHILQFLQTSKRRLQHPQILGISMPAAHSALEWDSAANEFFLAAADGDEKRASEVLTKLRSEGVRIATLCDHVIAPALHRAGEFWECGQLEVYEERTICEVCARSVHEMRRTLKSAAPGSPLALGGTVDGDPYTVAVGLAEIVLRECGWKASSIGNMLPFETLRAVVQKRKPGLLWLGVSCIRDPETFAQQMESLFSLTASHGTALVVGGRALTPEIRQTLRYTAYCDHFLHLDSFAMTMINRPSDAPPH